MCIKSQMVFHNQKQKISNTEDNDNNMSPERTTLIHELPINASCVLPVEAAGQ